jgi:ADP-ribosyl-[dinitrogen reductase] hydrolase
LLDRDSEMKKSTDFTSTSLLPAVVDAVREAGRMIREEFHRAGGPRGHGDHASIDVEVEMMLKKRLLDLRPCRWLGEETEPVRVGNSACWVVDPHDGTRDFMSGLRGSAVSAALIIENDPVLGVVYAPTAPDDGGDLFAWAEGGSITRNGEPVNQASSWRTPVLALHADAADYAEHYAATLPGFRIRTVPSPAYRLALAAAGEVDGAISLVAGLAPWDIAGGHALLTGAGKLLVDRNGKPMDYLRNGFCDGCIGGDKTVIEAVVAAGTRKGPRRPRHPATPAGRIADATMLSRAHGALLGQLAGDALGSAVEFETASAIARRYPKGVRQLSDGGTWDLIAGQPTDDSEMALALARSMVLENGFDREAVAAAYVAWRGSRPFDIGGTTSSGIAALAAGRVARSESESNGALMRISPIGIFAAGNPARAGLLAREDALLTHPSDTCQAASAALASAIAAGVTGGSAWEMWQAAHDEAGRGCGGDAIRKRLEDARSAPPADYQHQMGWVLTAFHNAFHWLMNGCPLEEAVVSTVGAGGDTDTNAAVCGALLGAIQGRDAVPLQWRNAILTCRPLPGTGTRHPRPCEFWPDDALELAEALLSAGRHPGHKTIE